MARLMESDKSAQTHLKLLNRPLRVLLCPDRPGWAFDNIANNIIRLAPDYIHITKHFMGDPAKRDLSLVFELLAAENIDALHLFWREDLFELLRPATLLAAAQHLAMPVEKLVEIISARALTTSVYDHLHLGEDQIHERVHSFHLIDAYTVSSDKLHDIYSSIAELPNPDEVITDGVHLKLFNPSKKYPEADLSCPVIGWVGNSAWGNLEGGDPKGYHRLFLPALDILKNMGISFSLETADSQTNRRSFDEMPDYYRTIDVLACTSAMEGTPNPVLEAMASGVAIVSTDVGIVNQAFGEKQSRFIVLDPTPETFALAIKEIIKDKKNYLDICAENLNQVQAWSWEQQVQPWWPFWLSAVKRANNPRMTCRRTSSIVQSCYSYQQYIGNQQNTREKNGKFKSIWRNIMSTENSV